MADINGASASASQFSEPAPPLVAMFLIKFDLKVGYTISWKQSLPDIPLEGVVEYKSLPSGLHNVKSDLVYFVHEQEYAGVSAFLNAEASAGERNARFISVGALVRLGDGRLGRAWEHAGALQDLAEQVVGDTEDVKVLEEYWQRWRDDGSGGDESGNRMNGSSASISNRRSRALSTLTMGGSSPFSQKLPEYHPAYSILGYLDTFGPLAFPLHRLALLRKRILVITPVPVRSPCEYVYDLSILSSLPHSLQYTPPSSSLIRLRPLFNLGIHDIPYLTDLSKPERIDDETQEDEIAGWIACTTDEILAMKTDLYDILVEMPHPDRPRPSEKRKRGRKPKNKGTGASRWPVIKLGVTGEEIKATQRDLRRYRSLRRALAPLTKLESGQVPQAHDADEDDEETHLLFNSMHGAFPADEGEEELQHRQDEEKVTEKASWSELAYSSFIWWAAAGEKEEGLKTEEDLDSVLLGNLSDIVQREVAKRGYRDDSDGEDEQADKGAEVEMAIIAYFHRVTKSLFENAEAALEPEARPRRSSAIEDEEQEDIPEGEIRLESEDLRSCGLDVWSERDRLFIAEFVDLWFERDVSVRGAGVECCGMRIC